jgi:hypothetical protein
VSELTLTAATVGGNNGGGGRRGRGGRRGGGEGGHVLLELSRGSEICEVFVGECIGHVLIKKWLLLRNRKSDFQRLERLRKLPQSWQCAGDVEVSHQAIHIPWVQLDETPQQTNHFILVTPSFRGKKIKAPLLEYKDQMIKIDIEWSRSHAWRSHGIQPRRKLPVRQRKTDDVIHHWDYLLIHRDGRSALFDNIDREQTATGGSFPNVRHERVIRIVSVVLGDLAELDHAEIVAQIKHPRDDEACTPRNEHLLLCGDGGESLWVDGRIEREEREREREREEREREREREREECVWEREREKRVGWVSMGCEREKEQKNCRDDFD